jgi:3-methyl-2-oxobutanoate hydroxymethyltransferase
MSKKPSIFDLYKMKENNRKIAWLTSYDFPTAQFAQEAGMEMILVGDSLGMCVYGYSSTVPVTMDQCIAHSEAVRRGAPDCFVVGDMPLGSYQASDEQPVDNAIRFLKEADVDAIKLEGGVRIGSRIQAITDAGVNVIGHIGLTPKFVKKYCNVAEVIVNGLKNYVADVKSGIFPDEDTYCYKMVEGEEEKFRALMKQGTDQQ